MMKINRLIQELPVQLLRGSDEVAITGITDDSRRVSAGCLFVARGGAKVDGRKFVAQAVQAGAVAVLSDEAVTGVPKHVTMLTSPDLPLALAMLAERYHGEPSKSLRLIGVTGTNGKTTIAYLIRHILNRAAMRCGMIGTVEIDDGRLVVPAELTTPAATELSRLLRVMCGHGCQACVMEASSHALHQRRTAGLHFEIGVFTNLTGDHLDYHKTMQAYLDAKAILFESLPAPPHGWAVINADDPAAQELARRTKAGILACSTSDGSAACTATVQRQSLSSVAATFTGPWGEIASELPLVGRHNVSNTLQALAACHAMGLKVDELREGLVACKAPPGRLQPVTSASDEFAVLVDYAHTDDALENVLRALRTILAETRAGRSQGKGKLRVVFGCGGDRDSSKRPRMARIASLHADQVIITSDNPRTEDPQQIIDEVKTGIPRDRLGAAMCLVDRRQAIFTAIEHAKPGDIVLIAGKGHEDYQIVGEIKRPFDDRKVAVEALRLLGRNLPAAAVVGVGP